MVDLVLGVSMFQLVVAGIAASVAVLAWEYRQQPGGRPLVLMAIGITYWAGSHALQPLVGDQLTYFIGHSRHFAAAVVSFGIFYVAVEYTDEQLLKSRWIYRSLVGLLVLTGLVLLTDPFHNLFADELWISEQGYLEGNPGPLFFVHILIWISLPFVTLGLFIRAFLTAHGVYRKQTGAIVIGGTLSLSLVVIEQFITPVTGLSLSIVGMTILCSTLLWAIFKADFLETVPVARELLIENMDDAVIALNSREKVVDMNTKAMELFDASEGEFGTDSGVVFAEFPTVLEKIEADGDEAEFTLEGASGIRHYEMTISPIIPGSGVSQDRDTQLGRLVVIHDVTDQKRRETVLERREEELALLKDLQSRFLRHNLRNRLNIIRSNAEFLYRDEDENGQENYDKIMEASETLLDWSTEARAIERLVEQDELQRIRIAGHIEYAVHNVNEEFPNVTFELDLDQDLEVVTVTQIDNALENLLDNAARYNTADDPVVEISLEGDGDNVSLRISDNGPGLNDHEIETIETQGESELHHGSGFGLWLVYWVVKKSGGDLEFNVDDGTTVELRFQAAAAEEFELLQ